MIRGSSKLAATCSRGVGQEQCERGEGGGGREGGDACRGMTMTGEGERGGCSE